MINRLGFYIAHTILGTIGLVVLLLLGLDLLFSLANELREVGVGGYTLRHAVFFLGLGAPQKIYQMFPMSALMGTLLGLGVLASNSELIAMQAAGISAKKISQVVALIAVILSLFVWGLGEGAAPFLDSTANKIKAQALSGGKTLKTIHGTWLRDGTDFVHIHTLYVEGTLEGITRYQFDDNLALKKAVYARFGDYVDKHWVLKDITETVFFDDHVENNEYMSHHWYSVLSPSILSVVGEKYLERLSMKGLWHTIQYRRANGLDEKPFLLAFFEKIIRPLSVGVMMLLAVPFVFGPLRSSTMGVRLLVGMIVGFLFYTFHEMFGNIALVYQIPPVVGASLPTLAFFILALLFLRRV